MKNIKPYTSYLEESFSDPFGDYPGEDLTVAPKFSIMKGGPELLGNLEKKFTDMLEDAKKPSTEALLNILKEFDKMNVDLETLTHVYNQLKKENPEFDFIGMSKRGKVDNSSPTYQAAEILQNRIRKARGSQM